MTDYTKTTDFTSKDSLPSGDSGKIIRGAEFGTEFDNIETAVNSKSNIENPSFTGNITVTGTVDGRDIAADGTKLDTIETSADVTDTANVTAAGAVMDSELTDITAVKALNQGVATTDSPTFAAVTSTGNVTVGGTVDGRDVAADGTKLDTVETNADVTDTTNVTAAGALMDSEVTNLDQVKAFDSADYATAAQGTTADNALPKTGGAMTGAITTNSTFDGRDVATDGTKLDGIEASADVTDTTNVTAAGAVMDSELTDIAAVKALNQGVATTDSPTFAGATVNGTVEFDGLSGTGAVTVTDILDQDNMSSNSATALATQQSIKAYVDSQVATSDTLAEVLANGNATGGTDVAFGTNDKALFGAGSDLQVYHSGSSSFITDVGTGDLRIRSNKIRMEAPDSQNMIIVTEDAGLQAFYNGTQRLEVTNTGIDVTGNVTIPTGNKVAFDTDGQTYISEDIDERLRFWVANTEFMRMTNTTTDEIRLLPYGGNLFSGGNLDVTGTVSADGLTVDGDVSVSDISPSISLMESDTTDLNTFLASTAGDFTIFTRTDSGINSKQRFNLDHATGDISFYEDTGTTAKFFWDAADESLGIGTSSVGARLHVLSGTDNNIAAGVSEVRFIGADKAITGEQANLVIQTNDNMAINKGGSIGLGGRHTTSSTNSSNFAQISGRKENGTSANFAGYLAFGTSDSASDIHERMRITSSGNVGIGTSSPSTALHVKSTSGVTATIEAGGGGDAVLDIKAAEASGGESIIRFSDSVSGVGFITYAQNDGGSDYMRFGTASTERMRIDSSGNLLVGTTTADGGYDESDGGASTVFMGASIGGAANGSAFVSRRAAPLQLNRQANDGDIAVFRKNGSTVGSIGTIFGDLTIGDDDVGIRFDTGTGLVPWDLGATTTGGSARDAAIDLGVPSARFKDLYLSGTANVEKVTAERTNGVCAEFRRSNNGHAVQFFHNSVLVGSVSVTGTATTYNTSSDQRLKDNIVDAPSASDDIDAIQVRSFDWKVDGSHQKYGMIAQELNTVAPEAVSEGETEEDMLGVDYSKLVPMLVKEIQSLRARVAQLETN